MSHRLSKIYTRTGDQGQTALGDGSRVSKDSLRVESYGTVDELNSQVGVLIELAPESTPAPYLRAIQNRLFDLGSQLCVPGYLVIEQSDVDWLERVLDHCNGSLAPLEEFVLPSGSLLVAQCHVARTVARRAERRVVSLIEHESDPEALRLPLKFLNRLSDLLFVWARVYAQAHSTPEIMWRSRAALPEPS